MKTKNNFFLGMILVISAVLGYSLEYRENNNNIAELRSIASDSASRDDEQLWKNGEITLQSEEYEEKVNINTADKEELKRLKGIGEKRAGNIIKFREKHGSFEVIEDIMRVSGIGRSIFNDIKDNIAVK